MRNAPNRRSIGSILFRMKLFPTGDHWGLVGGMPRLCIGKDMYGVRKARAVVEEASPEWLVDF
jgi:hypothetical protein